MRGQVARRAWRAELLEIRRTGAHQLGHGRKLPDRQGRIARGSRTNDAVDALTDQVHQAVTAADDQIDLGITFMEGWQLRQHDVHRVCAMHVHPQHAARCRGHLPQRGLGVLQIGKHLHAAFVEGLAVQRRPDVAGGALEQPRAEAEFQLLNGGTRAGSRHISGIGGAREAAQFDNFGEQAQGSEVIGH